MTKSVKSAAIGIALSRGDLDSLNQPLATAFSDYLGAADAAHQHITLREVLTQTAGMNTDSADQTDLAVNPIRALLQAPLMAAPRAC